ncbi:MAG: metallophosphoesterase [Deltaproteobacteria bacterium]|nr:metallophosphoesterase [Deltaproteobacteria bacterium]
MLMIALAAAIGIYGFFIEPYNIEVRELRMDDSVLGNELKGVTAVHLSDIHMSGMGRREKAVIKAIDYIKPDLIFLTGDYVEWKGDYEAALDFLSQLKAENGVYAVMGDYDYSNSRKSCLFCHKEGTGEPANRHNIRFLRNSSELVSADNGSIPIYGIDNTDSEADENTKVTVETPAIVLSHSPMEFDMVDNDSEVLMLSGDTHGGQIPLPGWLWGLIGYEKNARYNQGLYREGKKMMYVSRGIGTSHIPFRLFRRPEVVVIRF